jgi:hypothetical protein
MSVNINNVITSAVITAQSCNSTGTYIINSGGPIQAPYTTDGYIWTQTTYPPTGIQIDPQPLNNGLVIVGYDPSGNPIWGPPPVGTFTWPQPQTIFTPATTLQKMKEELEDVDNKEKPVIRQHLKEMLERDPTEDEVEQFRQALWCIFLRKPVQGVQVLDF